MRNIWTIARREYRLYFASPAAYMVAFLILGVLGYLFYANIVGALYQQYAGQQSAPGIEIIVGPFITLLLFGLPGITMRLLAEEHRMGTIELLLTAPLRDFELILGKWLGGFLFVLTLIGITLIYPIILNKMVSPGIDQGPLMSGYLGLILVASAMVAIGVTISSLFNNQIAAFFATLVVFLALWLISAPIQAAGGTGGELLKYLDFSEHFYNTFYVGIIDLKDIVYYLSVTALALYLGSLVVEIRRWR
jgi:ABC-2 type transport system permease protein